MRALLKENVIEALIGLLVLVVGAWFMWFAYDRTGQGGTADGYTLSARFPNATGVGVGTDVRVSGIKIGTVTAQKLDPASYQAVLEMSLEKAVRLPVDSSAAITSEGLLGGNYIALSPGGETEMLAAGGEITETQGSTDLMGLIGSYINRSGDTPAAPAAETPAAPAEPTAP